MSQFMVGSRAFVFFLSLTNNLVFTQWLLSILGVTNLTVCEVDPFSRKPNPKTKTYSQEEYFPYNISLLN